MDIVFNQETQYIDWKIDILNSSEPIVIMNGPGNITEYYVETTTYEEMIMLFNSGSWFLFDIKDKI